MISIIIVEDQPVHQEYFSSIFKKEEGIYCTEVIASGREAIVRIPLLKPDIVLVDLGLPDISGITCIEELGKAAPQIKCMALTVFQDDDHIFKALQAGAKGYILKHSKPYQIVDAVRDLYQGGAPISSEIASRIIAQIPLLKQQQRQSYPGITRREKEILELLAQGFTYGEVSDKIFISVNTLKAHVYRIYTKLNVDNRTEALNKFFGRQA